jgi:hypothetical protein
MSVDASVVVQSEGGLLNETFTELARQQLGPGRSYVVQAKGEVFADMAEATVRLEVLGFDSDETRFTMGSFAPILLGGFGTFALTTAFTAPDDEDFATAAIVSAARTKGSLSIVRRVRLLVLTVDSLSFTTV